MSTKAIRNAISAWEHTGDIPTPQEWAEMRKELDAIERAACIVATQGIYESPEGEEEKVQEAVDAAEDVFDSIVDGLPEEKQPW